MGDRAVMLFKVIWRDLQVWDLGRREPLGPGLGDLRLSRPQVGMVHGRPVLAGALGNGVSVWDLGTARLIKQTPSPRKPIAVTIGARGSVWASTTRMDSYGSTSQLRIHPCALRRRDGQARVAG